LYSVKVLLTLSLMIKELLQAIEGFAQSNEILAYVILGLSALVENLFPPVPGDTVVVFGAFLVGRGALNFTGVLIVTSIGSLIGFMGLFYAGFYLGRDYIIKKNWKLFNIEDVNNANKWFVKYGYLVILLNRFLSGIRSIISVSAGIAKMKPLVVTLLALIAATIWNGLLLYLGYLAGDKWEDIDKLVGKYSKVVMVIIGIIVTLLIIRYIKRRKKA